MEAGKSAAGCFSHLPDFHNFIKLGVIVGINLDIVGG